MTFHFDNPLIREYMYRGGFGLERETLRVNADGTLAQTPHPFVDNERISRDFCENQVEIITPPAGSVHQATELLLELHRYAAARLLSLPEGRQYLWPFSNPPRISGEDEIPVARFSGAQSDKMTYREYLARKYGKKKMLFCGIHCNFSFHESLLQAGFKESAEDDFRSYKDGVYLTLAQRLTEYGWLIVYLTAASPVSDRSLFENGADGRRYASPRCGEYGYWNEFVPILQYDSIEAYTERIRQYIRDGAIVSPSELYYPIRLKPKGENRLDHLSSSGVNHIELRMLDVNPLTPVGIFEEDIAFIQLFILYLMSLDNDDLDETAQKNAVSNFKTAALYDDSTASVTLGGTSKNIRTAASDILKVMREFFLSLSAPSEVHALLHYQENKLIHPENRYAVRIRKAIDGDFTAGGMTLAAEYAKDRPEGSVSTFEA